MLKRIKQKLLIGLRGSLFFAATLLLSSHSYAAITTGTATAQGYSNDATTFILPHTVMAGSDRLLLVGISFQNSNNQVVNTVTYDGTIPLKHAVTSFTGNDSRVEIWSVILGTDLGPQTSKNIIVEFDNQIRRGVVIGAVSFSDVHQTLPYYSLSTSNGNSTTPSLNVSSNPGEVVFAVAAQEEETTLLTPTGLWSKLAVNSGRESLGAGASANGAAPFVTMNWNGASDDWAVAGLSILATNATLPPTETCVSTPIPVNGQDVNAIDGFADDNIIAVADNNGGSGQIIIYNNGAWEPITATIPDEDFNDVFVIDGQNAVVVGDNGAVVIQVNDVWSDISISPNEDFTTVWAASPTDIYVAGDNGRIYHGDGTAGGWISIGTNNNNDDFVASWADATYAYFLDNDGEIFRYTRSPLPPSLAAGTNPITPSCTTDNIDFNGFTSDGANFYLFGRNRSPNPDEAVIFKWSGVNAWNASGCNEVFTTSSTDNINAISINPDNTLTAVGDDGVVVTSADGDTWTETSLGTENINAVYTLSDGTIIYGADNGSNQVCTEDKPHFAISFVDGSPATTTCTSKAIKIAFHNAYDHSNPDTSYKTGTINITTSGGNGGWSVYDANGTFQNNGNGSASYTFVDADDGDIILNFTATSAEVINFNIIDNTTPTPYTDFVSEDPSLTVSGPASDTFLDTFSNQSYNNSNGSLDWSLSSWVEVDLADGTQSPTQGNAQISGGGNRELRINTSGTSVMRAIDISSYASATFSFTYDTRRADPGDIAIVEINNGSGWNELTRYEDDSTGSASFDIAGYINTLPTLTQIRFRINGYDDGGGERFEVDNVQISATPLASCLNTIDHIRIEHDGEGLTCDKEQVTVKACLNADCTTEYTASDVTATLTPDGDTVTFNGNTLAYVRQSIATTPAAPVTLGATITSTPTPTSTPAVRCFNGTIETCDMAFVDSGFRFTDGASPPNSITIGTQVASKASDVNPGAQTIALQAVRTDTTTGACVGVFADGSNVNVEMISQCNDPTMCIEASKVSVTNNSTSTIINNYPNPSGLITYKSVPLLFAADSQALLSFAYPDVGQITLYARYNLLDSSGTATGNYMSGNSNAFVVKPSTFVVSNILRANDTANPANTTGTDTPYFVKASTNFKATVEAHDINGNITPNYGNENDPEGVLLSPALIASPDLTNTPAITNSTIAGTEFGSTGAVNDANGVASVINLSWPEVGIITITPSVTGTDANDYLGAGGVTGTTTGNVGRFVPHHLDTVVLDGCGGSFTYAGQPFTTRTNAMNNLTTPTITENYRGSFAKDVTLSTTSTIAGSFNGTEDIAASDFTDGFYSKTDVAYDFTNNESGPDSSFTIQAIDSDGINSTNATANEGTTDMRSGRLHLENTFGSELVDMAITAQVEYFDSATNNYVINPIDTCTLIDVELTDLDATDQLILGDGDVTGETCIWDDLKNTSNIPGSTDYGCLADATKPQFNEPLTNGSFNLYLKAPGAAKTGDIGIKLLSTPLWLQIDRDGDGNPDGDPTGTASFGLYRGDDRIIYWREVFN